MPGARILLVEDNATLHDLLRRNLEARQHQVCVADDARTALVSLRSTLFDLVILDINLPDQTGWEVLRIAQREGHLLPQLFDGDVPRLPVVMISAVRASMVRLKAFPVLAYLPKPFPMEALLRLAEEAAQRRSQGRCLDAYPDAQDHISPRLGEECHHLDGGEENASHCGDAPSKERGPWYA